MSYRKHQHSWEALTAHEEGPQGQLRRKDVCPTWLERSVGQSKEGLLGQYKSSKKNQRETLKENTPAGVCCAMAETPNTFRSTRTMGNPLSLFLLCESLNSLLEHRVRTVTGTSCK